MDGKRSVKVADIIQREVSEMIVRTIKDPRIGFVTITKVSVSDDCRMSKIYFSVTGNLEERERSKKGLESAKGYIRKELGRRISLRYTPEIMFLFDPSIEYAIHIEEILRNIRSEGENDGEKD